jgi:hypothetical protein
MNRYTKICLTFLILLMVAYPPLLLTKKSDIAAAFQYFAADTFYYLAVADNSVDMPYFTFDGTQPTNGFHPLWQYYLTIFFKIFDFLRIQNHQIFFAFASSIAFTALGTALFGVTLFRLTNRFSLSLISAVPGIYYLLFSSVMPHYGSAWSSINGMETGCSIFFFGLLVYFLFSDNTINTFSLKRVLGLSLVLTAITLSRLDDIFIFVPFIVYILFLPSRRENKFKLFIAFCLPPLLLIGIYLLYNISYSGMMLPVSGMVKGGSIELIPKIKVLFQAVIPVTLFSADWIYTWKHDTWRVLQLIIPTAAALTWLIAGIIRRRGGVFFPTGNRGDMIALLCVYAVLKGSYNIFAVPLWQQGHWYFPLSIMIFNLLAARLISKTINYKFSAKLGAAISLAVILWIVLLANSLTSLKIISNYNISYFNFWKAGKELNEDLKTKIRGEGIIGFDDGIICYTLNIPVMSGLGYSLDKEAFQALKQGLLLNIAYRRGFNLLSSLSYLTLPRHTEISSELLKRKLASSFFLSGQNIENWRFSIAYRPPESGWAIIKFEPEEPE